ncbi:uncharacterized protein DC041_0009638, partial [Schistosoma bovis]
MFIVPQLTGSNMGILNPKTGTITIEIQWLYRHQIYIDTLYQTDEIGARQYHQMRFVRNQNSGLNISVNGGFKQINNSLFHSNYGHGLVIWNLNQSDLSSLRQPNLPLKTHVHLSNFT